MVSFIIDRFFFCCSHVLDLQAPEVLRPIGASMHHAISNFAADLMSSVTALAESDVLALPEAVVTVKKLAADIFVNVSGGHGSRSRKSDVEKRRH